SASGLGASFERSIPTSAIPSRTAGWISAAGALPAERTSIRPPAYRLSRPAAIWLRPALCTQTNNTSGRSDDIRSSLRRLHCARRRLAGPHERAEHPIRQLVGRLDLDVGEPRP